MNALFVTGTDTGVGKTLATAILALSLRATGRSVAVLKPFATGAQLEGGEWIAEDARFLREALDSRQKLAEISPICLAEPLAPLVAARRAGIDTQKWPQIADKALQKLRKKYDFVVIEGVGGVLVPVCEVDDELWTVADFISAWGAPAVVVARRTLGTLNHTLLTARETPNFAGVLFCDAAPVAPDDLAAQTSPDFLAQMGLPVWGHIPFQSDLSAANLQNIARDLSLDWEAILNPPRSQVEVFDD